ncbi:hypothetical protein V2J09_003190 [Rumex salicifolius]
MEMTKASLEPKYAPLSSGFFKADFLLRLLATILSIVAISLMVTSGQSTYLFAIEYKARYTYSSAYRFAVGVDVIVCVCSMLSMAATLAFSKLNLGSHAQKCNNFHLFIFLHDLASMALAISGCAASTAIGYVALNGQDQTGWAEICSRVHVFCNKMIASIALAYAAFLCFFALTILSFLKARGIKMYSMNQSGRNKLAVAVHRHLHPPSFNFSSITIKPTPALRTLQKIIDRETSGRDSDGKLEIVVGPRNFDDVQPEKQHLDADAAEVRKLILRDLAAKFGLITELIGAFEGEGTGSVQVYVEFPRALV